MTWRCDPRPMGVSRWRNLRVSAKAIENRKRSTMGGGAHSDAAAHLALGSVYETTLSASDVPTRAPSFSLAYAGHARTASGAGWAWRSRMGQVARCGLPARKVCRGGPPIGSLAREIDSNAPHVTAHASISFAGPHIGESRCGSASLCPCLLSPSCVVLRNQLAPATIGSSSTRPQLLPCVKRRGSANLPLLVPWCIPSVGQCMPRASSICCMFLQPVLSVACQLPSC